MKFRPYLSIMSPLLLLRHRRTTKQCLFAIGAVLVASLSPYAQATGASAKDTEAEFMSVRELMRLDTELALSTSRSRLEQAGVGAGTLSAMAAANSGQLKLVAIYGVGKKLMAEVLIDSQPYVYMRGLALPVGGKAATSVYKLAGISGSCVSLQRQEQTHTLCLHPSLRVAR